MQIDKFTRNAIFSKNIWKLSGHADFLNFLSLNLCGILIQDWEQGQSSFLI